MGQTYRGSEIENCSEAVEVFIRHGAFSSKLSCHFSIHSEVRSFMENVEDIGWEHWLQGVGIFHSLLKIDTLKKLFVHESRSFYQQTNKTGKVG